MRRYTELCWDGSPGDEGQLGVQGFLTTAGTSCCEEGDVEGLYSRSCVLEAVVHAQVPALSSKAVFPRLLGEAKDLSSSKDTQLGCSLVQSHASLPGDNPYPKRWKCKGPPPCLNSGHL